MNIFVDVWVGYRSHSFIKIASDDPEWGNWSQVVVMFVAAQSVQLERWRWPDVRTVGGEWETREVARGWSGWPSPEPPAQELSDKLFRIASLLFSSLLRQLTIIILLLKTLPLPLSSSLFLSSSNSFFLINYLQFTEGNYLQVCGSRGTEFEKIRIVFDKNKKCHQHFS